MLRSLEKKRGWSLDRDKEWEVHYEVALYCFGVGDIDLFSLEQHMEGEGAPRVAFFFWEATWGKALTLDQVQKMGWF